MLKDGARFNLNNDDFNGIWLNSFIFGTFNKWNSYKEFIEKLPERNSIEHRLENRCLNCIGDVSIYEWIDYWFDDWEIKVHRSSDHASYGCRHMLVLIMNFKV